MSVGQASETLQPSTGHAKPSVSVPEENRWIKCPRDGAFVYHKRLERNLKVCPECNYHFRVSAAERLRFLVDPDSFQDLSGDIDPRSSWLR